MVNENEIEVRNLTVRYGKTSSLQDVSLDIPRNKIFAIIGPANSGKTTLLKCFNRTLELESGASFDGLITIGGREIHEIWNVYELRRKIGMVFPLPVGLPLSVYDNVAYAPRMAGKRNRKVLDEIVERCLRQAALWDEVKDRLQNLTPELFERYLPYAMIFGIEKKWAKAFEAMHLSPPQWYATSGYVASFTPGSPGGGPCPR